MFDTPANSPHWASLKHIGKTEGMSTSLFSGQKLDDYLRERLSDAVDAVARTRESEILDDAPAVAQKIMGRFGVAELQLEPDQRVSRSEPRETSAQGMEFGEQVTVPGLALSLYVPFEGDPAIFTRQGSEYFLSGNPQGEAEGGRLRIDVVSYERSAEDLNRISRQALERVRRLVEIANGDIAAWRGNFESVVRTAVDRRSKEIKERQAVADGLDFPVDPSKPERGLREW